MYTYCMQQNNPFTKEVVVGIRKAIKARCPTLKVRRGTGTAGAWIDIIGSEPFGQHNEKEKAFMTELMGFDADAISPKERKNVAIRLGVMTAE